MGKIFCLQKHENMPSCVCMLSKVVQHCLLNKCGVGRFYWELQLISETALVMLESHPAKLDPSYMRITKAVNLLETKLARLCYSVLPNVPWGWRVPAWSASAYAGTKVLHWGLRGWGPNIPGHTAAAGLDAVKVTHCCCWIFRFTSLCDSGCWISGE